MHHYRRHTSCKIYIDSFGNWPCLFFLLLACIFWLLPFSPLVHTLGPRSRTNVSEIWDNESDQQENNDQRDYWDPLSKTKPCRGKSCSSKDTRRGWRRDERDREDEEPIYETSRWVQDFEIMPGYAAACWYPALFLDFHVAYANRLCTNAMSRALHGVGVQTSEARVDFFDFSPKKTFTNRTENFQKMVNGYTQLSVFKNRIRVFESYHRLVTWTAGVVVSIYALLLIIPSFVLEGLSNILSGLKFDETLTMLREAQDIDRESRQEIYRSIAQETSNITNNSGGRYTSLFLIFKMAVCLISVGALIFTALSFLPCLYTLSHELAELDAISKLPYFRQFIWFTCSFKIQQMSNYQPYSANCIYYHNPTLTPDTQSNVNSKLDQTAATVSIYETLFCIISLILAAHAAVNFLSLILWMVRVNKRNWTQADSSEHRNSSGSQLATDVKFLLCQVRDCVGHVEASYLAKLFKQTVPGGDID